MKYSELIVILIFMQIYYKINLKIMQMEKYKFLEKLGRGSHGTVYLLEDLTNKTSKVVCKSVVEKHLRHAQKEVLILSKLCHKRIIKLEEFIQAKGSSFIILEYANRGTLDTVISFFIHKNRKATDFLLWSIFSQIAEGLEYLHSKNIIHRDIKPSNILINSIHSSDNEEVLEFKICDFSLSYQLSDEDEYIESSIVGTPFYMAPEIVSKTKYNNTVDIWGLGVTMYEVSCLSKPFKGENRTDLYKQIKKTNVKKGFIHDKILEDLVLKCLSRTNRPTAFQITNNTYVKLHLAMLDIKIKDIKIDELENKLKNLEDKLNWPPTPNK
jgi:serine/threonine protein kinase